MENHKDLPYEQERLADVLRVVNDQLKLALGDSEAQQSTLVGAQKGLREEADQMFGNLWSAQDFESIVTLSQLVQPISQQQQAHETMVKRIETLQRMADSPYFARLDLRFSADKAENTIYIGRGTLWNGRQILVYDWRAPVSSLFYRFPTGSASFEAPAGRVDCHILLKRQYEIVNGSLLYFFDADTVIQDAFLRKLLSQNASPQMKAIVETIQRDQDVAIRDETHELLMVQGVAGSGKTSIALHRVAYLMYDGLKNRLSEQNILILSPNTLFEQYIAGVLPELGERNVNSTTLERLLEKLLGIGVQSRAQRLEAMCGTDCQQRALMRQALEFKSSSEFVQILDRFLDDLPRRIPCQDVYYAGQVIATGDEIRNDILRRDQTLPLGAWLRRYEASLWQRVHALRPARMERLSALVSRAGLDEDWARAYSLYESGSLAKTVHAMTRPDCIALYKRLFDDESALRRLVRGVALPDNLAQLSHASPLLAQGGKLTLESASAAAYLKLRLFGSPMRDGVRQVVVDEAQDYGVPDFAVLNLLFPNARFTVLGDVNQALERAVRMSLYDDISATLRRKRSALTELRKSFRCTKEILDFSRRFLPSTQVESFNRQGHQPRVLPAGDIENEIAACRKLGYQSIALIVKTMQDARRWHARLSPDAGVKLADGSARPGDAFLIPLSLSKGLEFDAVLILDCDAAHYDAADGARLLYVACTRALHRLTLFYEGTPSPLLGQEDNAYEHDL